MTVAKGFLLGVDAGGTKTTAMVASADGETRSCQETGPGNPVRAGKEAAFANVCDAIEQAIQHADVAPSDIRTGVIGMAGAGTTSMQVDAAKSLSHASSITDLRVVPDYRLALPAAFPSDGIALIAGTGSIAHGVFEDQETRVGGHGYLIDDAGSGYWIGGQALNAIVRSLDGRGPKTSLTETVCQFHSASSPRELITTIHAAPDRLMQIASIAPLVVADAQEDDVARDILNRSADELACLVQAACGNLGYRTKGYRLALAGSLLTKTDAIRTQLVHRLAQRDLAPAQIATVDAPVVGAIRLAAQSLLAQ